MLAEMYTPSVMQSAFFIFKKLNTHFCFMYPSFEHFHFCEQAESLFWPVFVLATIAAIIASQAMISASFSCIKQSMALGCFPRLKIVHTSRKLMGQIYIPVINWFLMIMCILVVAAFRSTTDIANAYGKISSFKLSDWFFILNYLISSKLVLWTEVT